LGNYFKRNLPEEISSGPKDINVPLADLMRKDHLGAVGAPIVGKDLEFHPGFFRFLVIPHMRDLGVTRGAKNAGKAIESAGLGRKLLIYSHAGEVYHINAYTPFRYTQGGFFLGKGRGREQNTQETGHKDCKQRGQQTVHGILLLLRKLRRYLNTVELF
jgi:hypothetical protein